MFVRILRGEGGTPLPQAPWGPAALKTIQKITVWIPDELLERRCGPSECCPRPRAPRKKSAPGIHPPWSFGLVGWSAAHWKHESASSDLPFLLVLCSLFSFCLVNTSRPVGQLLLIFPFATPVWVRLARQCPVGPAHTLNWRISFDVRSYTMNSSQQSN